MVAAIVLIAMILRAVRLVRIAIVVDAVLLLVVALATHSTEVVAAMLLEGRSVMDLHWRLLDLMLVASGVISVVSVTTAVGLIARRRIVVEEAAVAIDRIDAERPVLARAVDWAIEVVELHELRKLAGIKHIAHIFVAHVKQAIILVDGVMIAIHHIVHDAIGRIDEVIVDLVAVIVLHRRKVELVGHAVAQEARVAADIAG